MLISLEIWNIYLQTSISFFYKYWHGYWQRNVDVRFWARKKRTLPPFFCMIGIKDRHMEWDRKCTETRQRYVVEWSFEARKPAYSVSLKLPVSTPPHEPIRCKWLWWGIGAYQHIAHKLPAAKLPTSNFQLEQNYIATTVRTDSLQEQFAQKWQLCLFQTCRTFLLL